MNKNFQDSALSFDALRNTKGGTSTTVTLQTMVDITTVNKNGQAELLYCDRRRKKINC